MFRASLKIFEEFVEKVGSEIDVHNQIDLATCDLEHLYITGRKKT